MSATLSPAKPKTVVFHSTAANLRIVRVPATEQTTMSGSKVQVLVTDPGVTYQFDNGTLVVDPELERTPRDAMDIDSPRKGLAGLDFLPTGPAGEEESSIDFLRRKVAEQPEQQVQRFFEDTPPAPDPEAELRSITLLTARKDVEGLADIAEAEAAGWGRESVIDSAIEAIRALEGKTAESAAEGGSGDVGDVSGPAGA